MTNVLTNPNIIDSLYEPINESDVKIHHYYIPFWNRFDNLIYTRIMSEEDLLYNNTPISKASTKLGYYTYYPEDVIESTPEQRALAELNLCTHYSLHIHNDDGHKKKTVTGKNKQKRHNRNK